MFFHSGFLFLAWGDCNSPPLTVAISETAGDSLRLFRRGSGSLFSANPCLVFLWSAPAAAQAEGLAHPP